MNDHLICQFPGKRFPVDLTIKSRHTANGIERLRGRPNFNDRDVAEGVTAVMAAALLASKRVAPREAHALPQRRGVDAGTGVFGREMRGVLGARRRDLVAQYFADHIFLYHCNQNLPHKFTNP